MANDMTRGNPFKQIALFTIPIFLGNLLQQVYGMIDMMIVGNTISTDAMAGVGSTGSITFLVFGLVWGLTGGFSVVTSQFFGAGDKKRVRRSVAISFELCVIITILVTVIATPMSAQILKWMQTPDQYFDYAYYYLLTVFGGIAATVIYNMSAGILRSVGDSRTPLYFLIISSVLNIGLDFLFILAFDMHYIGAGLATVISQLVSGVGSIIYMFLKYPELRPEREDWKFDIRLAWRLVTVGLPMALQYSITALGCVVYQAVLNGMNDIYPGIVASTTASNKIFNLIGSSYNALGMSISTFAGQNYGALEHHRVRKGVNIAMLYAVACSVVGFLICFLFDKWLFRLFVDPYTAEGIMHFRDMLQYEHELLMIYTICSPALGAVIVYRSALQSVGYSAASMVAGVLELIARVAMVLFTVDFLGYFGVFFADPAAWLAADLFLVPGLYIVIHKYIKKQKNSTSA